MNIINERKITPLTYVAHVVVLSTQSNDTLLTLLLELSLQVYLQSDFKQPETKFMNALMSSFHDTTNKYKKFVVEVNEENYC